MRLLFLTFYAVEETDLIFQEIFNITRYGPCENI